MVSAFTEERGAARRNSNPEFVRRPSNITVFTHASRAALEPPPLCSFRIHWFSFSGVVSFAMSSISPPVSRVAPQARLTYLGIFAIIRRQDLRTPISRSQKRHSSGTYHRSDFTSQSYTGLYDAGAPTEVCNSCGLLNGLLELTYCLVGTITKRAYTSANNTFRIERSLRRVRCWTRQSEACIGNRGLQPLPADSRSPTSR